MPILHLIRKPLSILRTACSSVFQLAASDRETSSFRPGQQQASDQAFWPSLASKEESVTIAVKVEPEMAATNANASALDATRSSSVRNRIGSVGFFQRNQFEDSKHPKFDIAYTGLFLFFCLAAVTTIATKQIEQRNKTANYLDHKITPEMDDQYTCACTLPQSLLALQKTPIQIVSNHGLRQCYNKDELSTITVVQFNNDTAYDVAKTVESFNASVNISYASNEKGWVVEQVATELVLWTGNDDGTLSSICKGVPYNDTVFTLSLGDPNLPVYFNYPLSYMRMAIEYNCSDCNVCSPNATMTALNEKNASFLVPLHQWVECSGFGRDTNLSYPCNATQSYHGRCNLYPTFDISMSTRLKDVIDTLESMNSTLNITTRTSKGQNGIDMHANVLYYNQSKVVEKNNVTYGYFQRDASMEAIWPILVASYPNIAGSCLDTLNVSVCNGTSICNVYKELDENGVSTAALNCIDFSQDYDSCVLMANVSGNDNIRDKLCERKSPFCQNVPPYQVKYLIPDLARTPPDNMSVSIIMNNSLLQTYKNGVCSTVYAEVVPYTLASGTSVFLETTCNSQDLCTITGKYNAVNDTPDMLQPRSVEGPDKENLESSLTPNYVCYKLTKVPWFTFTITLIGTIGGWLTTMYNVASMVYPRAYDKLDALCTTGTGSGTVGPAVDKHDPTNGGDPSNADPAPPSSESTSSRHDPNIEAGQSDGTKRLESPPVETVGEQCF